MGIAQLHLKQCYRLIPCLPRRPLKISWTWANTKAIKRITLKEAEQLLLKKKAHHPLHLTKLHTLSPSEPLAIVRTLAPHLRANVVFPKGRGIERLMVKRGVPLFYPAENARLPELTFPSEKYTLDEDRPIRSDVCLEDKPFLEIINLYRCLR